MVNKRWMAVTAVAGLIVASAIFFGARGTRDPEIEASPASTKSSPKPSRPKKTRSGPDPNTTRRQEAVDYASAESTAFKYFLRDDSGNFDAEAARKNGFTDAEAAQISALYEKAREQMTANFKSRIEQDPRRSDPSKAAVAFLVRSDPTGGDKISSEFRSGLVALFGAEKAEEVYSGFRVQNMFGAFGRQEVRLKVTEDPQAELGEIFEVQYYAPEVMVLLGSATITRQSDLSLAFGTAFDG